MTQNKAPETLKRCPWGCHAHHGLTKGVRDMHGDLNHSYAVWCKNGHARIQAADKETAFEIWNTRSDLVQAKIDAAVTAAYESCAQICNERKLSPNRNWSAEEQEGYENAVCDMQMATAASIRAALIRESE